MTTPDDKTALADQRLRRIEALISDRDALRERVAALEAALDTETQGRYSALMLSLADQVADRQHAKIIVE